MEKYSLFIDPMSGVNPFVQPKYRKITLIVFLRFLLFYPLYILYRLRLLRINWIIKIKKIGKKNTQLHNKTQNTICSNCVTQFDCDVISYLYGNCKIMFPEGAFTNNRGVLMYKNKNKNAQHIVLKYTDECIFMYGGYIEYICYLICFLGYENCVKVQECEDLLDNRVLPVVKFTARDKEEFMKKCF
ncbi:hypothetical protein EHP00_1529 [Ecytonucleospora hepatopenaei]|uniref:Uncharacterized protein n=1 Tax=Ecytonucleospora hepatopenaei TaxID=646526 RepID=A0A1W0E3V2_9MICR|nr:hypothetical protein EHP00_1529 [Ecytonucleospora hepatopenaei]